MARGASTAISAFHSAKATAGAALELRVQPHRESVYRTAISVVGGVVHELIIEAQPCRGRQRVAVVGLEDLFEPGIWKLAVADQDPQAAGVEEGLVDTRDVVDDAGYADRIVRPAPLLAVDRDTARNGSVDVGEIPRLKVAVGPAGARKHTHRFGHLLLEVEAHARAASIGSH